MKTVKFKHNLYSKAIQNPTKPEDTSKEYTHSHSYAFISLHIAEQFLPDLVATCFTVLK